MYNVQITMLELKVDWKHYCCWACDLNAIDEHKFLKFVTQSKLAKGIHGWGTTFGTKDLRTFALDLGVCHDFLLFDQYILDK